MRRCHCLWAPGLFGGWLQPVEASLRAFRCSMGYCWGRPRRGHEELASWLYDSSEVFDERHLHLRRIPHHIVPAMQLILVLNDCCYWSERGGEYVTGSGVGGYDCLGVGPKRLTCPASSLAFILDTIGFGNGSLSKSSIVPYSIFCFAHAASLFGTCGSMQTGPPNLKWLDNFAGWSQFKSQWVRAQFLVQPPCLIRDTDCLKM